MEQNNPQDPHRRPYLIAVVLLAMAVYVWFFIWIALRPADVLGHEDKALCLLLLIAVPGRFIIDAAFAKTKLDKKQQDRFSVALFVGLILGLLNAVQATSWAGVIVAFVGYFLLASICHLILDALLDRAWQRWTQRKR